MTILEATVLRRREHDTLAVLRGCRWRLIEVENALSGLVPAILVAHLRAGSRRSESLNRTVLILIEILLN